MMKRLRPFFSYYGSKWRIAPKYPEPKHGVIIEPFCGSAQYSMVYPEKEVRLYDLYEPIVMAWDFLINSSSKEILNIPSSFSHIDDLRIPDEAKALVGFNVNPASQMPKKQFSPWKRDNAQFWGDKKKQLIIEQKQYISHWKVFLDSYENIDNEKATWFIDPPYQSKAGRLYVKSNINYGFLEKWILERDGQFIACDMEGVTYGDFKPFLTAQVNPSKKGKKTLKEMIWHGEN